MLVTFLPINSLYAYSSRPVISKSTECCDFCSTFEISRWFCWCSTVITGGLKRRCSLETQGPCSCCHLANDVGGHYKIITVGNQRAVIHGLYHHSLLRHMRQHKSNKYKRNVHNKNIEKTENYKIDSKRTLQQLTTFLVVLMFQPWNLCHLWFLNVRSNVKTAW